MNAIEKVLPLSPIRFAADEIIAHLAGLQLNGSNLFESVGSGIWVPAQNANGENTPAARVWYRNPYYNNEDSPQFFMGHRVVTFGIGIYLWMSTKDADGNVVDPMQVLTDWTDYVLQSLQLLDVNGTGWTWSGDVWSPVIHQNLKPDYSGQMRKYNNDVPLQPPWYTVEIPFLADVFNLPNTE